jgi:predicted anti-sigma-YlaC factor YlaD
MDTRTQADRKPHPDALALDAVRSGGGSAEERAHVASCPSCRAALAELALLEEAIKAATPRIPDVPRVVELRILRTYRDAIARPAPAPPPLSAFLRRWALPTIASAAAATLLLTANPLRLGDPGKVPTAPPPAVDALLGRGGAGRVDIVDAFRLARALRDGHQVASDWDADASGAVDGADVEAVARRAVAL